MAQTTNAISQAGFKVEVSSDGSSWTDVSGASGTVQLSGGDVKVGSQHTADGSQAIVVTSNKTEPIEVTIKTLYTETAGEAWKVVKAAYDAANKVIYLRWSPKGGGAGSARFTTAAGGVAAAAPLTSCLPPDLDAAGEDPAMFEFSVMAAGLLEDTVPEA